MVRVSVVINRNIVAGCFVCGEKLKGHSAAAQHACSKRAGANGAANSKVSTSSAMRYRWLGGMAERVPPIGSAAAGGARGLGRARRESHTQYGSHTHEQCGSHTQDESEFHIYEGNVFGSSVACRGYNLLRQECAEARDSPQEKSEEACRCGRSGECIVTVCIGLMQKVRREQLSRDHARPRPTEGQ